MSPEDLVKLCLDCLGVNISLNIAPSIILPPFPPQSVIDLNLPNYTPPNLSPITIPGFSSSFEWPKIDQTGFPTMMMGFSGASLAGVSYVLDFLPIDPQKLPELPNISLFVKGFTGAAIGLPTLPAQDINIKLPTGDLSIPFPGITGGVDLGVNFDPSGIYNMIGMFIAAPFVLFKGIVESIISLNLKLPNYNTIVNLLINMGIDLGFPKATMDLTMPCVAKTMKVALVPLG